MTPGFWHRRSSFPASPACKAAERRQPQRGLARDRRWPIAEGYLGTGGDGNTQASRSRWNCGESVARLRPSHPRTGIRSGRQWCQCGLLTSRPVLWVLLVQRPGDALGKAGEREDGARTGVLLLQVEPGSPSGFWAGNKDQPPCRVGKSQRFRAVAFASSSGVNGTHRSSRHGKSPTPPRRLCPAPRERGASDGV